MEDKIKRRDKNQTKQKIIRALGEVIEANGAEKVGVNLIARTAGVNKVLIYRYFGSIEGLMESYISSGQFAASYGEGFLENQSRPQTSEAGELWKATLKEQLDDLLSKKASRELIKWEIGSGNSVLTESRNERALNILKKIGPLAKTKDTAAVTSLLLGGIYYLAISSDFRKHAMDIDLQSETGWERIKAAVEEIVSAFE